MITFVKSLTVHNNAFEVKFEWGKKVRFQKAESEDNAIKLPSMVLIYFFEIYSLSSRSYNYAEPLAPRGVCGVRSEE